MRDEEELNQETYGTSKRLVEATIMQEDLAAFVEPSRAWKLSMQQDELVLCPRKVHLDYKEAESHACWWERTRTED